MNESRPQGTIKKLLTHPFGWIATGLGSGLAPKAPGTFGTLAALVVWWFALRGLAWPMYLAVVAVVFALGIAASNWTARRINRSDPGLIVIDEFIGLWLALFALPGVSWPWIVAGFALFRLFDIAKPWPVGWADRRVKGGLGVMLDDALAGAMAWAVLQIAGIVLR